MMITEIQYPEVLPQALIERLKKVEQLTIGLSAQTQINAKNHAYSSKLGGVAYMPKGEVYPRNKDGQPLALIAQLNLSEIFADPHMISVCNEDDVLKHYPKTGMLSFFNDATDDLMGLEFKEPFSKTGYRVMYFAEVIENEDHIALAEFDELAAIVHDDCYGALEITDSYLITASLKYTVPCLFTASLSDQAVKDYHEYVENDLDNNDDITDAIYDLLSQTNVGHAIGGYPWLTQSDPRSENDPRAILLFQLDSVGDVMLGDCGSMQFFISTEDLDKRNFSNVLYEWACC